MRRSACVPFPTPGAPTRMMRAALFNSFVVFIGSEVKPFERNMKETKRPLDWLETKVSKSRMKLTSAKPRRRIWCHGSMADELNCYRSKGAFKNENERKWTIGRIPDFTNRYVVASKYLSCTECSVYVEAREVNSTGGAAERPSD